MGELFVVEWFGKMYGPFHNEQSAAIFAERSPVQTENMAARGVVHRVIPALNK